MMARLTALLGLLVACTLLGGGAPALAGGGSREQTVLASPAPQDYSLLEISFAGAPRNRLSAHTLRASIPGPFGSDYLAAAAIRVRGAARARALVLLVDRPSALLDPARLALHLRIARSLGQATLLRAPNVIARGSSPRPRLCRLGLAGRALSGGELAPLATRGAPLDGFSSTEALAQAYDLACGLAHSSAFVADISGTSSCTGPSACTPTPVAPVPIPAPQPPGCTPCDPRPGFACPLVARPAVCVAEKAGTH